MLAGWLRMHQTAARDALSRTLQFPLKPHFDECCIAA